MDAAGGTAHGSEAERPSAEVHVSRAPIVVTLVHGTFAKGAPWTRDGSILRREIAAGLGEHGRRVVFDSFEWSGRNTHRARVKAGYRLATHITELKSRYPLAKHFIVAHSHGGNVALFAHKHLPEALHATGIATLGTPFVFAHLAPHVEGKTLDQLLAEAAPESDNVWGIVTWIVGIPAAIIYDNWFETTNYNAWYWFVGAAAATGLFAGYIASLIVPHVARAWHRIGGKRAAVRLAKALHFGAMPSTHILSFIYPGDEAGRLLDTLEATTSWPTRAIRWIKDRGAAIGGGMFLVTIAVSVLATIAADFVTIDDKMIENVMSSLFASTIVAGIYALIALAVIRYLLSFLRGHPAGFGWERPSIHAHVDIGIGPVADVPVAKSNEHQEVPFAATEDARTGLRHSGLYEDRRILRALAYWMAHVK